MYLYVHFTLKMSGVIVVIRESRNRTDFAAITSKRISLLLHERKGKELLTHLGLIEPSRIMTFAASDWSIVQYMVCLVEISKF